MNEQENRMMSAQALAYLGDCVIELCVRSLLLEKGLAHSKDLNKAALRYVSATAQAEAMKQILPALSEEETGVYRRAFNHKGLSRPAHASYGEYRAATGFEAVLGALHYLGEKERLAFLLDAIHENEFIAKEDIPK